MLGAGVGEGGVMQRTGAAPPAVPSEFVKVGEQREMGPLCAGFCPHPSLILLLLSSGGFLEA